MLFKKRYIVGLREVQKHLNAGNMKMIILATDMEKVEEQNGIDDVVGELIKACKRLHVPLVFAMTRKQLGCLAKNAQQKVSAIGIQNF